MKNLKPKAFALLMVLAFVSALCLLFTCICLSYRFAKIKTDYKDGIISVNNILASRQDKTDHILQKDLDYTAFILGGSKAGGLHTQVFDSYTNEKFYNLYTPVGTFNDYGNFTDILFKRYNGSIKEIVLHLSSHETDRKTLGDNPGNKDFTPYQMEQNPFKKIHSIGQFVKEKYLNLGSFTMNLKNIPVGISTKTGERSLDEDEYIFSTYQADSKKFEKDVLSYWGPFDKELEYLFYRKPELPACRANIKMLSHIKDECARHGAKLTVVIGPTFIGELYKYASPEYIEYLKEIVKIQGEVWNFSGINEVNMNPYNFYNGGHYYIFVGDRMIETMYQETPNTQDLDAFGILLTEENIDSFISRQKEKWALLKEEYDTTGTISLRPEEEKGTF